MVLAALQVDWSMMLPFRTIYAQRQDRMDQHTCTFLDNFRKSTNNSVIRIKIFQDVNRCYIFNTAPEGKKYINVHLLCKLVLIYTSVTL